MIRTILLVLMGWLVSAAGPLLPVPPMPPTHAPNDRAAPVPNPDLFPPPAPVSQSAALHPHIFHMNEFGTGLGFIPGSAYQSPEERKPTQTPGFTVTVPIQ